MRTQDNRIQDSSSARDGSIRDSALLFTLALLAGCGAKTTDSPVTPPGAAESAKTKLLEAGAAVLQDKPPIGAINTYLDGFHFYSGKMKLQMEAHHYCAILNDDVIQCVIYDGNVRDAKLMGVEYIIDERLFAGLPVTEKALWHSHRHEVKSGQLIAPGIPRVAEHALMEKLVHTYGKTWHTWHTDLHQALPLGVPQLMMGFTADGQVDPQMIAARDKRFGVDTAANRKEREEIVAPPVDPGADGGEAKTAFQIADPTGSQHMAETASRSASGTPAAASNGRSNHR